MSVLKGKDFQIEREKGLKIHGTTFGCKQAKASILIVHGMAEHRKRYFRLASFLHQAGFEVSSYDHRGHGETAGSLDSCGFFSAESGWTKVVNDLGAVCEHILQKRSDLPLYIIGHSMGSLITRTFLARNSEIVAGAIFSGTSGYSGIAGSFGEKIAEKEIRRRGATTRSQKLDRLISGTFMRNFKKARTEFDWISSDEIEVDKYVRDPWCGFICSTAFYRDLFTGLKEINNKANINGIRKELPIIFLSGDKDPVGQQGKGIRRVVKQYRRAGITDISMKLYENGRHEIFNEIFYPEVYEDVRKWLDDQVQSKQGENNG